mgnify:CR=1 FL=1
MLAVFHFAHEDDYHATDEEGLVGLIDRLEGHRSRMPLPMRSSIGKQISEYTEGLQAIQLKKFELGIDLDTEDIVSEQPEPAQVFQFPAIETF